MKNRNPLYRRIVPASHDSSLSSAYKTAENFVTAIDSGNLPNAATMQETAEIFQRILTGFTENHPSKIWSNGKGRPAQVGFTTDEVVSAHIEYVKRRYKGKEAKAKITTAAAFGMENHQRELNRHWQVGKMTVEALSNADLRAILKPHRLSKTRSLK